MAESFWQDSDLPASENFDATQLALALAFLPEVDGQVTHIRFRAHSTLSGGTYIGTLWEVTDSDPPAGSGNGTIIGQATFGAITAGAWNTVALSPAVDVVAGALYKAALYTSVGRYLSKSGFFVSGGITRGNLTAVGDNVLAGGFQVRNGSFFYAAASPDPPYPQDGAGGAYLVDVVFEPGAVEPSEGTLAANLNLAPALTGARASQGTLAGAVNLAPALTGARASAGALAGAVNLQTALAGARASQGAVAGAVNLAPALAGARASLGALGAGIALTPALAGARPSLGALAAGLNLTVSLTGTNGETGRPVAPFPFPPGPASGFPWTLRPVKSFQEVSHP